MSPSKLIVAAVGTLTVGVAQMMIAGMLAYGVITLATSAAKASSQSCDKIWVIDKYLDSNLFCEEK